MNNILVINSGSSSIKFQLIKIPSETVIASGMVERIGLEDSALHYKSKNLNVTDDSPISDHSQGLKAISKLLMDPENGVIKNVDEIAAVGHRVVHGGSSFSETIIIDENVKNKIRELFSLAPLHNPPNLAGIEVAEQVFPNAKQVAVFDTAFHHTIPTVAHQYAIPNKYLHEHHIQVYGFHGTSHKYVSEKARESIKGSTSRIITAHLGNGCSITAIKDGKSIDTSLGFGPMNGLIMGTRSGDIDQSVIFYMIDKLGYSTAEVSDILHKKSGMLGLTGYSDLRDIEREAEEGNRECKLALEMNAYRIKKYIGAYAAAMNGLDVLIFTGGIGENSSILRKLICTNMDYLGIEIEDYKNDRRGKEIRSISKEKSPVNIVVIPTNEELEIAKQTHKVVFYK